RGLDPRRRRTPVVGRGVTRGQPECEHADHRRAERTATEHRDADTTAYAAPAGLGEELLAGCQVHERALEVGGGGAHAARETCQSGLDPALALDEVTAGVACVDVRPRLLRLDRGQLAVQECA